MIIIIILVLLVMHSLQYEHTSISVPRNRQLPSSTLNFQVNDNRGLAPVTPLLYPPDTAESLMTSTPMVLTA
jgi:hypothetical protein